MSNRTLRDLFRGRGAHADPLASIADLSPELAGRRLPGVDQTIWQLVWHMNYWMDYELRSMDGPEVPYPSHASASWPESDAPPTAEAWPAEVSRFRLQLARLADWATRAESGDGARPVHPAKGETVQDVLWQMVAHNSYHLGQVVQLRRAFGAWPPPEGGDTW